MAHSFPTLILFFLLFASLALAGCVTSKPAAPNFSESPAKPTNAASSTTSISASNGDFQASVVPRAEFSCENDPAGIRSRAYVLLMGFADHQTNGWDFEKKMMEQDPLAKAVLVYDQDETTHLPQISGKFLSDMDVFLAKNPVDELVLFGSSAGGVTASYSIARLNFSGPVALHTMASPIKGYDLTGFRSSFLGDRQGFLRDIAVGFGPFDPPGKNVRVYHHKTVTDTGLLDYCGELKAFCDVREIQNNNLANSQEFFYPQYDHDTIMRHVIVRVLKCYNPSLVEPTFQPAAGETPDSQLHGLHGLCSGDGACETYCRRNSYECETYCMKHPENGICQKQFSFVFDPDYVPLSHPGPTPKPAPGN